MAIYELTPRAWPLHANVTSSTHVPTLSFPLILIMSQSIIKVDLVDLGREK